MSQNKRVKVGATPGKLAVIGILAVVMVVVVASNWPSAAAPPVADAALAAQPPGLNSEGVGEVTAELQGAAPASPFGEFAEDHHWPKRSMQEVTAFDPFAVSAWATTPAAGGEGSVDNEQQINALLAAENAIILVSGDKRIARVGDQEYQVGDVIGRYTISEISAKGVVLSEDQ